MTVSGALGVGITTPALRTMSRIDPNFALLLSVFTTLTRVALRLAKEDSSAALKADIGGLTDAVQRELKNNADHSGFITVVSEVMQ